MSSRVTTLNPRKRGVKLHVNLHGSGNGGEIRAPNRALKLTFILKT